MRRTQILPNSVLQKVLILGCGSGSLDLIPFSTWLSEQGVEIHSSLLFHEALRVSSTTLTVGLDQEYQEYSVYSLVVLKVDSSRRSLRVLRAIKKKNPLLNVLVISEKPSLAQAVQAMKWGAEDYLDVRCSQKKFFAALQRIKPAQKLNYIDDVTGLYNARYLNPILENEIFRSQATKSAFSVLFIDVDHFRSINQAYGHSIGTQMLRKLGRFLQSKISPQRAAHLFRYGGDEFVIVLPECALIPAEEVAQQICTAVQKKIFLKKEGLYLKVTISIGIATYPSHAQTRKEIIEMADLAMYSAKKRDRKGVWIAERGRGSGTAQPSEG